MMYMVVVFFDLRKKPGAGSWALDLTPLE